MILSTECFDKTVDLVEPLRTLVRTYLNVNEAAQHFFKHHAYYDIPEITIDHITPRTKKELADKARPFVEKGFARVAQYSYPKGKWIAWVYFKDSVVLFIDRALPEFGKPDSEQIISKWIDEFPEDHAIYLIHHIACRVGPDIEKTVQRMEAHGIRFAKNPDGSHAIQTGYDEKLKQIFTEPHMTIGKSGGKVPGTVFELIYRHPDLSPWAFLEEQANTLMKQSTGL